MGKYEPLASTLLYGGPGAGKSALAVSAFWNWRKREQVANGKWITFGAEDNPALMVPEEFRHTEKGTSLRLTSPLLDSQAFLDQFDLISRKLLLDAGQGKHLDVLVIDGLSEFDLLFEETYKGSGGEDDSGNFGKWNGLLSQMFSMMMRTTHTALGCHIIMTARVMEKKKAKQTKRATMAGDPGFLDFDYYPSMRGSFRLHMPHYFSMVLYMETRQARVGDKVQPVHIVNMVRNGDFHVKNQWEWPWIQSGRPSSVANPMWPSLWKMIAGAIEDGKERFTETTEEAIIEEK